jgi:EAL domain-containing protein (putative c-di-GMP-specific phosphodiesterase class I)
MKDWLDAGIAPPLIAVNLSTLQFKTPLELENDFEAILAETGVPPQRIELELTESVLMDASREHGDVLLRLRKSGFRIAIDDFGTGFSSLIYLRRFPVDRIKIAQAFMGDLTPGSSNAGIVQAAIALAKALKLDVIVEGVETAAQLELVKSMGAREVQGYYYSRPLPAAETTALLGDHAVLPLRPAVTAAASMA